MQVQPKDLNNGVINACFLLLFKDLIKLYACYNDGIINLLGESISLELLNRSPQIKSHMSLSLPSRKVLPDEEKPVQRRAGDLQEIPDANDAGFRVL